MMNQKMRVNAFMTALVRPTISLCVFLGYDWARDLKIDTAPWLYVLGWLVLFLNAFYRARHEALRKAAR